MQPVFTESALFRRSGSFGCAALAQDDGKDLRAFRVLHVILSEA